MKQDRRWKIVNTQTGHVEEYYASYDRARCALIKLHQEFWSHRENDGLDCPHDVMPIDARWQWDDELHKFMWEWP